MTHVLPEAYELVEEGLMTADDFRDFSFTNAARFFGGANSQFFDGTAVETDVADLLASRGPGATTR